MTAFRTRRGRMDDCVPRRSRRQLGGGPNAGASRPDTWQARSRASLGLAHAKRTLRQDAHADLPGLATIGERQDLEHHSTDNRVKLGRFRQMKY